MDRLTERDSNGITFLVCREGCNGGPACFECEQKAINRLAAYEDTGLEPEEIETLLAEREAAWISVKDRTPKDDDDGLEFICMTNATGRCNGVMSLNWAVAKIRGKIVRRWMWRGMICPWEVTHWKPLPTPPDRQQTEN